MLLSDDVLRRIVGRLALWDARAVQRASPAFAALVHEAVEGAVQASLASPRPRFLDRFLASPPGFRELVHDGFVGLRSPRDTTLQWCAGGVRVRLFLPGGERGQVDVDVVDLACWPTLQTARETLEALRWLAQAGHAATGQRVDACLRAKVHRPVSEVLNTLARAFGQRHLGDCARVWP